jgi:GNAT superfamily N-acetyltransferase
VADLDRIFFESSATRLFSDDGERDAFRERWLGRYLRRFPNEAFVAVGAGGAVGYLVGCLDSAGASQVFADIGYYGHFEAEYASYPAHLHVNVADGWRGAGIGGRLIEAFAGHCAAHRIKALHAVTAQASRAASFYAARGFNPVRSLQWQGRLLVLYGRSSAHKPVV